MAHAGTTARRLGVVMLAALMGMGSLSGTAHAETADPAADLARAAADTRQANAEGYRARVTEQRGSAAATTTTYGVRGAGLESEQPRYDQVWVTRGDSALPAEFFPQIETQDGFGASLTQVTELFDGSLPKGLAARLRAYVAKAGGDDSSYFTFAQRPWFSYVGYEPGRVAELFLPLAEEQVEAHTEGPSTRYRLGIVGDTPVVEITVTGGLVTIVDVRDARHSANSTQLRVELLSSGSAVTPPDMSGVTTLDGTPANRLVTWHLLRQMALIESESIARNANAIAASESQGRTSRKHILLAMREAGIGPHSDGSRTATWRRGIVTIMLQDAQEYSDLGPACAQIRLIDARAEARSCPVAKGKPAARMA